MRAAYGKPGCRGSRLNRAYNVRKKNHGRWSPVPQVHRGARATEGTNLLEGIDNIVTADERDAASEGKALAREYKIDRAPFFLVRDEANAVRVYTTYFRFVKEVLNREVSGKDAVDEMMEQVPDFL